MIQKNMVTYYERSVISKENFRSFERFYFSGLPLDLPTGSISQPRELFKNLSSALRLKFKVISQKCYFWSAFEHLTMNTPPSIVS